jgi:DNA-directed RNA polymerase specialized sigma subunit
MNKCAKKCVQEEKNCQEKDCRLWIDYSEDLNCTLIAANKKSSMTLAEVAKRMNLSIVRVKQIQDKALQKLQKNSSLKY